MRQPMIQPQGDDGRSPADKFSDMVRRLAAVPKAEVERAEKREARKKAKTKR